jgi:hypothetical protein
MPLTREITYVQQGQFDSAQPCRQRQSQQSMIARRGTLACEASFGAYQFLRSLLFIRCILGCILSGSFPVQALALLS